MKQLQCPACQTPMDPVKYPDITVERCSACQGTWLDRNELNIMATGLSGDIEFCSLRDEPQTDLHAERSCPKCPEVVLRKTGLLTYSDIIFDSCGSCGGFFLDGGELQNMNRRLGGLTALPDGEEMREYNGVNLVVVDLIHAAEVVGAGMISFKGYPTIKIQLSVYFEKPLPKNFRISAETWTHKFATVFGFFGSEDVETGDSEIDSKFLIGEDGGDFAKSILKKPDVKNHLVGFVDSKPQLFTEKGIFEITRKRVVYTEGPYHEDGTERNIKKIAEPILDKMLAIARAIEA